MYRYNTCILKVFLVKKNQCILSAADYCRRHDVLAIAIPQCSFLAKWRKCLRSVRGVALILGVKVSRAKTRLGAVGGRKSIFPMLTYRTLFCFLVVIIKLVPNSVFQLYWLKDYYKQKQWNTLPVTMITEIMNLYRLLWWQLAASTCVWRSRLIIKSASFRAVQPVWGKRIHVLWLRTFRQLVIYNGLSKPQRTTM